MQVSEDAEGAEAFLRKIWKVTLSFEKKNQGTPHNDADGHV